jgi:hypothetical protein
LKCSRGEVSLVPDERVEDPTFGGVALDLGIGVEVC